MNLKMKKVGYYYNNCFDRSSYSGTPIFYGDYNLCPSNIEKQEKQKIKLLKK